MLPARNYPKQTKQRGVLPVLRVENICVRYGQITAVHDASLQVKRGEAVALLGVNGAGKSTVMLAVAGLLPLSAGRILYDEGEQKAGSPLISVTGTGGLAEPKDGYRDISGSSTQERLRLGIALVPEGRRVFGLCTVKENLLIGAHTVKTGVQGEIERMYALFPPLYEKRNTLALSLSGGQQQMLAIARALMSRPRLLLLDEPTMGLSPALCADVYAFIQNRKREGLTVLVSGEGSDGLRRSCDRTHTIVNGIL